MKKYNPNQIEAKWQKYWQAHKTFLAKDFDKKPKKYILVEFPYPSGEGLHMGHLRPYVAGDVYSRFKRLQGHNVIYPIGWDAFGLPAENYAIKKGIHPSVTTTRNIKNAKRQIQSWGLSFDWSREINTTDPDYYKWTQWLFLQFYKKGLAYEATGMINWCPNDKTGLANEEVIDGKCERCGATVEKKELRQWYLKITAYAEKLLEGLKGLPQWPEAVKLQQENWIGKSVGAEIEFQIKDSESKIKVFTTRPDTIFGATYMVVAPEHKLISNFKSQISNWDQVQKYIEGAKNKPEMDRTAEGKEKTGVELKGLKAINPATKAEIPVWAADYVLMGYGTGAIMAVPAHDERDFEFAKKFKLPVRQVISKIAGQTVDIIDAVDTEYGFLVNSGKYDGQKSEDAMPKMAQELGKMTVQYKLRDWVFSRQRYWGEPIPLIHCEDCGIVPVPDKDLPVKLPKVKKYEPTGRGESPLADITSWVKTKCPKCKKLAWRETNTMPQWAGSSWYWLRYADPKNKKTFADKKKQKYWTPVDVYFGGMEHTTLHLLYSRFWNLFFYDQKLVTAKEPYVLRKPHGIILASDGEKMSKSRGNVVNPDDIVKSQGADTLRMYELFLGPHEMTVSWNDQGVLGVRRFLDRVWGWVNENTSSTNSILKANFNCVMVHGCPSDKKSLIDVRKDTKLHWIPWIRKQLQKQGIAVYNPLMPKPWHPSYEEWKKTIEKLPINENSVLIGHSCGGTFLVRWLSESKVKIKKLILVAAAKVPKEDATEEQKDWFGYKIDPALKDRVKEVAVFIGAHDNDRNKRSAKIFAEELNGKIFEFSDKGHFMPDDMGGSNVFPELLGEITKAGGIINVERALHKLIKKITEDLENFRYNTAVAAFMEFHNEIRQEPASPQMIRTFLTLLYPFAPHICEELNSIMGNKKSLQIAAWPTYDPAKIMDQNVDIIVQVNGKVRGKISVARDSKEDQVKVEALKLDPVVKAINAQTIKRVVFVPNRLINLVI